MDCWRNRVAEMISNWAMRFFATIEYRAAMKKTFILGMYAQRDEIERAERKLRRQERRGGGAR